MLQDYASEYAKLPGDLRELVLTALTIACAGFDGYIQDPPLSNT